MVKDCQKDGSERFWLSARRRVEQAMRLEGWPRAMARRIRRRGEYAISGQNHPRAGMPGDSGASAVNTRAHTSRPPARTGLRVHWAPGIPHALCLQKGERIRQNLGRVTPRSVEACLLLR